MKKIRSLLSCIALSLFVFACNSSSGPKEVLIKNKFKIQLPEYMHPNKGLNKDASLAYINGQKEIYVMVVEDSFEEVRKVLTDYELNDHLPFGLDSYCQIRCSNTEGSFLTTADFTKLKQQTINGLKAYVFENTRTINQVNTYYQIVLIEGKDTYYQVVAWTLANRKDKHKTTLEKMCFSFEEL